MKLVSPRYPLGSAQFHVPNSRCTSTKCNRTHHSTAFFNLINALHTFEKLSLKSVVLVAASKYVTSLLHVIKIPACVLQVRTSFTIFFTTALSNDVLVNGDWLSL